MAQNKLEASLVALIEDLKKKVRTINKIADEAVTDEPDKVQYIREKTVSSLNYVADKIADLKMKGASDREIVEVMKTVSQRSKELYSYALSHIDSLRKDKKETLAAKTAVAAATAKNVQKKSEVKTAEKKEGELSVEERALRTLKGWLSPESDDK